MSSVSKKQLAYQQEVTNLETTIAGIEAHRGVLGDLVADTALELLRERLATLIQPDTAPDERKRVTVLFADVSGYTALSENLDPEDVATIMNELFEAVTIEIHRYGGTIDKYAGDAVMALFGAPQALENHEEMAVRAALAMLRVIKSFSSNLEAERGFKLQMRIGLNTGEVLAGLVGGLKARSYTVMGDTVNLAARLESAAPVGGILASSFTTRKLHEIFDLSPPEKISVKGKSDEITVYQILGEKSQRGRVRGLAGLHAPMIGREAELKLLQETFAENLLQRSWQATAVTGNAGLGKSRLQNEFTAWVLQNHPQARVLISRSFHHTRTTPYYFIGELVRNLFSLSREVDSETAVNHLTASLEVLEPTLNETERLYQLGSLAGILGFTLPNDPMQNLEPEQRRDRTFLSLERIFASAAAMQPLVILIDDMHWADALSLDFLERTLNSITFGEDTIGTAMWLILSRPAENQESKLGQLLNQLTAKPHQTIDLLSLDNVQAESLIEQLLGQKLSPDLRDLITNQAQGNPFYVEEVIRSLIEDRTLEKNGKWRITRDVAEISIPPSVQDILAARIDRLPPQDKQVTQHASIIGRIFWQHILNKITETDTVEPTLFLLEMRQLAERMEESQIVEDWEWVFHHGLIQEVAYNSVPKNLRRVIHQQVAQILESQLGEHNLFLLPLIAEHYESGQVTDKAIEYLGRAAEQAAVQFANLDAINYFSRAIKLLMAQESLNNENLEKLYQLINGRVGVYHLIGQREQQSKDLEQLKSLASALQNNQHQAEVALRYANYYAAISNFPESEEAAKEVVNWAEKANSNSQKVDGLNAWAFALLRQGKFENASQHATEAYELAKQDNNERGQASGLFYMGIVQYFLSQYAKARDSFENALTVAQKYNDLKRQTMTLTNLVGIYHGMGDLEEAKRCCEDALAIAETTGDRATESTILTNLGIMHHTLGNLEQARIHFDKSLHLSQSLQNQIGQSLAANNLSLVLKDLGESEKAKEFAEQALAIDRVIGDKRGEGYSLTAFATIQEKLSAFTEAKAAHEEALTLRREIGQDACAIDNLAGLANVALQQAHLPEASKIINEALAWIDKNGHEGIEYPLRVYLVGFHIFAEIGNAEQAVQMLQTAHDLLTEQSDKIRDAQTQTAFLENVPIHKDLQLLFREKLDS